MLKKKVSFDLEIDLLCAAHFEAARRGQSLAAMLKEQLMPFFRSLPPARRELDGSVTAKGEDESD